MKNASNKRTEKQYPRLFTCSQQNVISIARLAWGYCLALIARFAAVRPAYTPAFVADELARAEAANNLPNNVQRKDSHMTAHVELIEANDAVCLLWRTLKEFIRKAFTKDLVDIKLEAAGYGHYEKAKNGYWEHTATLITMATEFMVNYDTELKAEDNMATDFPTQFKDTATDFQKERDLFMEKMQGAKGGTLTKDKAIYDVEHAMSLLFSMGKVVFYNEPEHLSKFTFTDLIKEVRGNDPAGVKGLVRNSATNLPIAGVQLSNGMETVLTDANGRFKLTMASGTYTFTFTAIGYQTLVVQKKKIQVGVMSRFSQALVEL